MSGVGSRTVLVTGAGGKTGLAVIRALAERGVATGAFVRSAESERTVKDAGAREAEIGDLRDPEAIARAVEGTRAVYLICPNMTRDEPAMAAGVVDACRQRGVQRLVYHSVLHPQVEAMPHHWAKMRVEEALFESGLDWTILQPAAYMQNLLAGWRSIVEEGRYRVPYAAETRLGMVDLEDIAEVAAKVLTEDGHVGATYELAGSEVLNQSGVAQHLTEALGRPVEVEVVPWPEWREKALSSGVEEWVVATLVSMFRYYERHGFWGNGGVLTHLLGRSPTGMEAFLDRVLAETARRDLP